MDDIINKLISNKNEINFEQIELEINLKIQCEKTKQLQLIKDIKNIEKKIDFILLDWNMPILNGLEVASLVRGNDDLKKIDNPELPELKLRGTLIRLN